MSPADINQDVFCSWLCQHEATVFAHPSAVFESPLAHWLFDVTGRLYGVDGARYGLALMEDCYWKPLPRWAQMLVARLDTYYPRSLSGDEVFAMLAYVETALLPRSVQRCVG